MPSWKKPTPNQVERAIFLAANSEQRRFLFDSLKNPLWIAPLKEKGVFQDPPAPMKREGTVAFPPWPESRYLARMASITPSPEEILQIILAIETENAMVWEDFVDAAVGLPKNLAKEIVPKATKWLKSQDLFRLPEKLGRLVSHLAAGGETDSAISLARALFELQPDSREVDERDVEWLSLEAKAKFHVSEYGDILKATTPQLVKSAGLRAIDMLCDLLERAVELSRKKNDRKGPEDYSFIWHELIDAETERVSRGPKEALVSAVRAAVEQHVASHPEALQEIVEHLEARRWRILHRMALYLLARYPEPSPRVVVERAVNRALFDADWAENEYSQVLNVAFPMLDQSQQDTVLDWIMTGPPEDYGKHIEDASRLEKFRKRWQQERLAWIGASLPKEAKAFLDSLTKELGEVSPRRRTMVFTSWVGPTSPKTAEELESQSVQELIGYLRSWEWSGKDWDHTPEGLGRVLSSVVSKSPKKYAEACELFKGLDPTYVRALLDGLENAADEKRCFDWEPVLLLSRWVVEQPREIPGRVVPNHHLEIDPDWTWCRKTIARLLSKGLTSDGCRLPIRLRREIWLIVSMLAEDPDPPFVSQEPGAGPAADFATESINTVRGEALHTVMRYALWLRQEMDILPESKERTARGFDEMPEVRELLDQHLDVSKDASPAIRAVYGQWLPWLVAWDKNWTAKAIPRIFAEHDETLQRAAWETYIRYCHPYDNVVLHLKDQYLRAVLELDGDTVPDRPTDADEGLAQHLMTFAWRGKIEQKILDTFWTKASPRLREYAVEFMGRALYHTEGDVPPIVQERFKQIWEARAQVVELESAGGLKSAELSGFGWWFASDKLNRLWSLANLTKALRLSGKMESAHLVAEQLGKLASMFMPQVLEALTALIESDRDIWSVYAWRDEAKGILTAALASRDPSILEAAKKLVNRLGKLGNMEFWDLLRQPEDEHR